jgi:hypothetical protein
MTARQTASGHLEDALKEIRDIAHVSEGAEFYSMVADKALKGAK